MSIESRKPPTPEEERELSRLRAMYEEMGVYMSPFSMMRLEELETLCAGWRPTVLQGWKPLYQDLKTNPADREIQVIDMDDPDSSIEVVSVRYILASCTKHTHWREIP